MNATFVRRTLLFTALILLLLALIAAFNLWRFSALNWLQASAAGDIATEFEGGFSTRALGTELTLTQPTAQIESAYFSADVISLRFNLLSVLIGQPNLQWVGIESPVLEWSSNAVSVQQLRWPIQLGFQELSLTNGLLILDDTEVHNLELSLLKNGVFGEYAVQTSAEIFAESWQGSLGFSTLLGMDGEDNLVLGKSQFDANLTRLNWTGRIAGKLKSLSITPDNQARLSYLNWSSNWKTSQEILPYILDWAGGLTQGQYADGAWTLDTLDTAIAYRDSDDVGHTFAIQSNASIWKNGDLNGQLGLSLLAEYPPNSAVQSYNLVMTGQLKPDESLGHWHTPTLRLATVSDQGQQQTHEINAEQIIIHPDRQQWTLDDGNWTLFDNALPTSDFGFGQVTGRWPELTIDQTHRMSEALSPALTLISQDVEKLDALFSHLVP